MNELAVALQRLDELDVGGVTEEQISNTIDAVDLLKQAARELDQRLKRSLMEYLRGHGDLVIGERRYYIGRKKTTKCVDTRLVLQAILEASGGDLDSVMECLSSQPFKPATTKKLIGDNTAGLFYDDVKETVEGKPVLEVKCLDRRFVQNEAGGEE